MACLFPRAKVTAMAATAYKPLLSATVVCAPLMRKTDCFPSGCSSFCRLTSVIEMPPYPHQSITKQIGLYLNKAFLLSVIQFPHHIASILQIVQGDTVKKEKSPPGWVAILLFVISPWWQPVQLYIIIGNCTNVLNTCFFCIICYNSSGILPSRDTTYGGRISPEMGVVRWLHTRNCLRSAHWLLQSSSLSSILQIETSNSISFSQKQKELLRPTTDQSVNGAIR